MAFLDEKYLIGNETGAELFETVKGLPVIDAHNHADVAEIAANQKYTDPWQLCAATDHYVWEMLRKRNVPEEFITGKTATNKEKWLKLAAVFPEFVGNPVYEWIHLDLRRSLGIENALLSAETAEELWDKAVASLETRLPQTLVKAQNIEAMCSTDDPADTLEHHETANKAFGRQVIRPTWRPDKAVNIYQPTFPAYIRKLENRFGTKIGGIDELVDVLRQSHEYFEARGCVASDHGIQYPLSGDATKEDADRAFRKAMEGKTLAPAEIDDYMSYLTVQVAEMDAKANWVFQMHIGAVRDVRDVLFKALGPDVGGDVSDHMIDIVRPLCRFLNKFDNRLKVVLYCLDPHHQASLATVARAFGRMVRLGSGWWFNDTPVGMRRQLEYIGSVDLLYNFAGMVSDSRKILSYASRFEMFRRVLCDVVGTFVLRGQMPRNLAEKLVRRMSYDGPKSFYDL